MGQGERRTALARSSAALNALSLASPSSTPPPTAPFVPPNVLGGSLLRGGREAVEGGGGLEVDVDVDGAGPEPSFWP